MYLAAAFEQGLLGASERVVGAPVIWTGTVVAGHDDDRVLQPPLLLQHVDKLPYSLVEEL